MGPPPSTTRCSGRSVSENTVSLVSGCASASPSIGGNAARPPVATHALANFSVTTEPSSAVTSTAWGPTNRAAPRNTSTPLSRSPAAESTGLMAARTSRIRPMAAPKSTDTSPLVTPSAGEPLAATAACPLAMTAFDGTQPTFRQSPPSMLFSISATRAPSPAAPAAVTSPAVPPPMASSA